MYSSGCRLGFIDFDHSSGGADGALKAKKQHKLAHYGLYASAMWLLGRRVAREENTGSGGRGRFQWDGVGRKGRRRDGLRVGEAWHLSMEDSADG